MKYRKKPVVIEAFQFYVDNMPDWFMDAVSNNTVILHNCNYKRYSINEAYCEIKTLEGVHRCNGGDYVIKGIKGELYPCKADIFKQTYEEVKQMTKIEELEQKLNECQKELAELKESKKELAELKESKKENVGKWKPVEKEQYWYRNTDGKIYTDFWSNHIYDEFRYKHTPIFKTEEECERYWRFMDTVKEKSYSFSEEEWEDDEVDKLVIYYDYTRKEFGVTCTWVCKYLGEIYFKNEADAKYIIDNFKEELLEYWI